MVRVRPTILLISEDSSKDAIEILKVLTPLLLRQLSPTFNEDQVLLQPLTQASAQRAAHGNRWKSRRPADRADRLALIREVGGVLLDGRGFVLFHIDGDRPFAERERSENVHAFADFRVDLAQSMQTRARDLEAVLRVIDERLLLIVPFYSIEAWLFQNTEAAIALCPAGHPDIAKLRAWAADRGLLDELEKPKGEMAFRSRHNLALAKQDYPLHAVLAARKSLAQTLDRISGCAPLQAVLAELRPAWAR